MSALTRQRVRFVSRLIVLTTHAALALVSTFTGLRLAPLLAIGSLGLICVTTILAEVLLRLKKSRAPSPVSTHRRLLEERLRLLGQCPFDVDEFLDDHDRFYAQPGGITDRRDGHRVPRGFQSRHINVLNDHRETTQSESRALAGAGSPTIWVLGGSTVLCVESPDAWTLPSRLAHHIGPSDFGRVVNCGVSGATARDRIAYLRSRIAIKSADLVILYFGVNEGKGLRGSRGIGPLGLIHGLPQLLDVVGRWSHVARVARRRLTRFSARDHRSLSRIEGLGLRDECDGVSAELAGRGVKFLAILQPNVCVAPSSTPFRSRVIELWGRQIGEVMDIQYEEFRRAFHGAIYFSDLSRTLDDDAEGSYVDWMHLAWTGNDRVAAAIAASAARAGR